MAICNNLAPCHCEADGTSNVAIFKDNISIEDSHATLGMTKHNKLPTLRYSLTLVAFGTKRLG